MKRLHIILTFIYLILPIKAMCKAMSSANLYTAALFPLYSLKRNETSANL